MNDLFVDEITLVVAKGADNIESYIHRNLGTIIEIKHQAFRIVLYPDMEYLAEHGSVYTFSNGELNLFV